MSDGLKNNGEEYILKNDVSTDSLDVGLFNDGTDSLGDADDDASTDITTEPSTSNNYARQTGESFSVANDVGGSAGDWGLENDNTVSFSVSNNTENVDAYFVVENTTDDIIFTGSLSSSRDLTDIDTLDITDVSGELN